MASNICPPMWLNRATFYPSFANVIEYWIFTHHHLLYNVALFSNFSSQLCIILLTSHDDIIFSIINHIEYLPIISSSVLLFLATLHYLPTTISSSILLCSPFTQSHLLLLHVLSVTQPASQEASALTFHRHPSVVHCQTISTRAQIIPIMSCTKSSYMMMSHYWRWNPLFQFAFIPAASIGL